MTDLQAMGKKAAAVKPLLQRMAGEEKDKALLHGAEMLERRAAEILAANERDMEAAQKNGMSAGLLDRLKLTEGRIGDMAEGLRQVAGLPDCIGEVMEEFGRPNGLKIKKVRVPMGVIGIIYEGRPNVTADAFGLCFKTGNAVILKGGSAALHSNAAVVRVLREALEELQLPPDALQLIEDTDRQVTVAFMKLKEYVDLLIPRGSEGLIKSVVENSTIPVIETGTGNCHVYVDRDADLDMAAEIIFNAKTQRIGVCNACGSYQAEQGACAEECGASGGRGGTGNPHGMHACHGGGFREGVPGLYFVHQDRGQPGGGHRAYQQVQYKAFRVHCY